MKHKKISMAVLALTAVLGLSGCGEKNKVSVDDGKLTVYTSFYPMYDFTKKIGGDKINVVNLVSSGVEPHDWEPSTKDLVNLKSSDMIVYNGLGMESWIEKLGDNVDLDKIVMVEASKGVKLLKSDHEDEHEHNEGEHGHEDGHEHDKNDKDSDEKSHEHGEYDPHVWLSPVNAKKEMENIKNGLIKLDPNNKKYYEENYGKYAKMLDDLDSEYKSELSKTKSKDIVVSHESFGYICERYGLNQKGIEGISPDSEPDAKKMVELTEYIKKNNVKYVFFEELVSPKVAQSLAKETKTKTEVLNPLEGLNQKQIDSGEDYFSVMKSNLKTLVKALSE